MNEQSDDSSTWKTTLFPTIDSLDVFLEGDWRDRPASEWAISCSGTLQAKIERYRRDTAHKTPKFISKDDAIPFQALLSFANTAYGYNGWSSEVLETNIVRDLSTEDRFTIVMESKVRVTLQDGTYHESTGMGTAENIPEKSMAFKKAKKESITAATKRCIQGFGDLVLEHEQKLKKGYYSSGGLFDFHQNY